MNIQVLNTPLVSIIIPTYNRAHLIRETLDSILEQTYTNWECIVVDDGSTDTTKAVLKSYTDRDARFQYHKRPIERKKGANSCRNYGLSSSKGDYIQFLDSDDYLMNNKIAVQLKEIINFSDRIAICPFCVFKDNLEHLLLKNDLAYYKDFNTPFDLFDCLGANDLYIPIHSFLVSKSIILRSGEWNENLKINQDGEYFSRVLINTKYIKFCKNTLVYYRRNEGDSVSVYKDSNLKDLIESWKLIEKQLKPHYKSKKIQYVKSAKNRILSFILEEHYWFVLKNFCFFKESILNKIKNKISQK